MPNRLIIVEDDKAIADAVALNLRCIGYECECFYDGSVAAESLEADHAYDLAVLDIMLPGTDGFELLSYMKKYSVPVIYMTARTDCESEIKALRDGAEDYIVKPFAMPKLIVRIEKILERTGKLNPVYHCGDLSLDAANRSLTKAGQDIELPPMEFDVLRVLMKNKNRTVSRQKLLDEVWGEDYFGDTRTLDVRIANIRKKLDLSEKIRTISKSGYRLEDRKK